MKVQDILDKKGNDVYTISPDIPVFEALQKMAEKEIGAIVVVKDKKMVGILSERDYARKVILKGKDSQKTLVSEIMTSNVTHASPDQELEESLSMMEKGPFNHMPVLDDGNLVGIFSIKDVKRRL